MTEKFATIHVKYKVTGQENSWEADFWFQRKISLKFKIRAYMSFHALKPPNTIFCKAHRCILQPHSIKKETEKSLWKGYIHE